MTRESGMANDRRMKRASKAVAVESLTADLDSVKKPEVCRPAFWDLLPGWERQAAHRPGRAFCMESLLSVARG